MTTIKPTLKQITRLRKLLAAASPLPWVRGKGDIKGGFFVDSRSDAALITEAINRLPDLLEAAELNIQLQTSRDDVNKLIAQLQAENDEAYREGGKIDQLAEESNGQHADALALRDERDAAIARAEKAEAERDALRKAREMPIFAKLQHITHFLLHVWTNRTTHHAHCNRRAF